VIHHGEGLALLLEAGDDGPGVHPLFKYLQGDPLHHGFAAFGEPNDAEAANAQDTEQDVGPDGVAGIAASYPDSAMVSSTRAGEGIGKWADGQIGRQANRRGGSGKGASVCKKGPLACGVRLRTGDGVRVSATVMMEVAAGVGWGGEDFC